MRRIHYRSALLMLSALGAGACGAAPEQPMTESVRQPTLTVTQAELSPDPPNPSLGSVGFDGTTIILGSVFGGATLEPAGIRFFTRGPNGFEQKANVAVGEALLSNAFGNRVAVDGSLAVVSAYDTAFALARTGSTWTVEAQLSKGGDDVWIPSVAIDGDTVVLGAPGGGANGGSVRVYRRSAASWSLEATLTGDDASPTSYFGSPVALHDDVLLVSAIGSDKDSSDLATSPPGAVYVFRRDGASWARVQKLFASDAADGDLFGAGLAFDGTTLAVGLPGNDAKANNAGAIQLFSAEASGFVEQGRIDTFPTEADLNGRRLAVHESLLVNVPRVFADYAQVLVRAPGGWEGGSVLKPSGSATQLGDTLGLRGNTVVAGADGHAYVFELQGISSCTSDGTSANLGNGQVETCSPYLCKAGACATACSSSATCAEGFVCDQGTGQGTCVASSGASEDSGGCQQSSGSRPSIAGALLAIAALAWGRRRRRERR